MEIPFTVTARKDTGLFNSKIGIWLFLASEVMLFGGLFSSYLFLRIYADYPWPERTLPILPGLINTFVLIGSSVTVVFAWAALKMREWRKFQIYMSITLVCAALFMVLKAIEYNAKFHHQAVRIVSEGAVQDYAVLEGHVHKVELKDGKLVHAHKDDDGKYPDGAFYANKIIFQASELNFAVTRPVHEAFLETILEQAEAANANLKQLQDEERKKDESEQDKALLETPEIKITLARTIKGQTEPGADVVTMEEGTELSRKLLDQAEDLFLAARAHNQDVKTRFLRQKWHDYREAHPYTTDNPDWKAKMSPEWKEISDALDEDSKQFLVPITSDITFKAEPAVTFTFAPSDLQKFATKESLTLKDGTTIKGTLQDSPMFLGVDAIDFRFTAQRAEEENIDPQAAIAQSWVLTQPKLKLLWDAHQIWLEGHTADLAKKGKEPTDTEKYRVNWQEMVAYGRILEENDGDLAKFKEVIRDGVDRPEVGSRASRDRTTERRRHQHAFFSLEVSIPREKVAFEVALHTRSWNNYYAIYFTHHRSARSARGGWGHRPRPTTSSSDARCLLPSQPGVARQPGRSRGALLALR